MSNGATNQKDTPTTDFTQCLNRKDTPMYPVIDMNLNDVVEDIRIILDGSAVAVDGITATAEPNPSYRPGDTPGNETHRRERPPPRRRGQDDRVLGRRHLLAPAPRRRDLQRRM